MAIYVRRGICENGYLRVVRDLAPIDETIFEAFCKEVEPYYLSLDQIVTTSYDDSDDERVEPTSSYSVKRIIRELNPRNNAEHLLMVDGKIIGVVFTVTNGNNKYFRAFSFDGKVAQSMRLGWSASHSSSFEYVDRVSLIKKEDKDAPETARDARFVQSEMYPSL